MAPRLLITGVCGFTGRHLVAHLRREERWQLVGAGRSALCDLPLDDYVAVNLTDSAATVAAVRRTRPTAVMHLAAVTGHEPAVMQQNVAAFRSLCSAIRSIGSPGSIRLVTIGSAAELGLAGARRLPVTEQAPCEPETAYGRGKLAMTRLATGQSSDHEIPGIVARTFNLIGPGLGAHLSVGNFVRQIAAIRRGDGTMLRCGPLDARRDFLDVRDAVRAYAALLECGVPGELYNVCRGKSVRIGDLLTELIRLAEIDIRLEIDETRRPGDLADVYGDHTKLTQATGWRPSIPIEESLCDMLDLAVREQDSDVRPTGILR